MSSLQPGFRTWLGGWREGLASVPSPIKVLAAGSFVNSVGNSFVWPLTTIYVHEILGKSLTAAGFVLMLQAGANLVGQTVGGTLFDRFGGKRVLMGGLLASAAIVTVIAFFRLWTVYVAAMGLLGFSTAFFWSPVNAYIARLWPDGGRRAFNLIYVINNLGVAIGASFGGLVAGFSFRLVFLVNAVTLLVYLAVLWLGVRPDGEARSAASDRPAAPVEPGWSTPATRRSAVVAALAAGNFLAWMAYSQWSSTVSIFMKTHGYGMFQYGFLWTVNGALIFLLQPLLSLLVRRAVRSLGRQLAAGAALYATAFALVAASRGLPWYIAAMAVMTLGEVLIAPALPAAVAQLAPPERLGFFQGFVGSMSAGGRMVGPTVGGFLYDRWGPRVLWPVVMGIAGLGSVSYALYARLVHRPRGSS